MKLEGPTKPATLEKVDDEEGGGGGSIPTDRCFRSSSEVGRFFSGAPSWIL